MAKYKKKKIEIELRDRDCPICGALVSAGSPLHRCDPDYLHQLDMELDQISEDLERDIEYHDRTYNEKLQDARPFIESEDFFYNDEDEL